MPEFIRVTDDVEPARSYSIVKSTFDKKVHTLIEDEADPATDAGGDPLPTKPLSGKRGQSAAQKKES